METIYQSKKAGIAIFISERADFRIRKVIRNKKLYYLMSKQSIQQQGTIIFKMYVPEN